MRWEPWSFLTLTIRQRSDKCKGTCLRLPSYNAVRSTLEFRQWLQDPRCKFSIYCIQSYGRQTTLEEILSGGGEG